MTTLRIQASAWFDTGLGQLESLGQWIALLGLRTLLAWEFFESGREKLFGPNWFADIQDQFPFPFDLVPPEVSWQLATWIELIGGAALLLGLATRFFGVALAVLTVVAIAAVHWPADWMGLGELWQGYAITDAGHGNFKLPLLFLAMLMPLILLGPGRLSMDAWIRRWLLADPSGSAAP
ncbi:MAG: DoxX family protein [Proteobacteria bacterium]|nr:DoxX family protein [Pseudomonadota bacterium]